MLAPRYQGSQAPTIPVRTSCTAIRGRGLAEYNCACLGRSRMLFGSGAFSFRHLAGNQALGGDLAGNVLGKFCRICGLAREVLIDGGSVRLDRLAGE